MQFYDRHEAGRLLAEKLNHYQGNDNVLILGLARGGVVVAFEVAKILSLPLNVVVPRKIGAPGNPELALGSIMENGEGVFNHSIIHMLGVSQHYIEHEIEKEKVRAQQRLTLYRQYAPLPDVKKQTVILVDDGIATGSTMLASIQAMRQAEAQRIVVAVPVASSDALKAMEQAADEVVCLYSREDFIGVGMYYRVFDQTDDKEVVHLLQEANKR
jgi:putative phosphoribosyl transferase